jgi:hypothetical protein
VIKAAAGEADPAVLRESRRWSADAWRSAVEELSTTGWLDVAGHLTAAGLAQHDEIEASTDRAAMHPWRALGDMASARAAHSACGRGDWQRDLADVEPGWPDRGLPKPASRARMGSSVRSAT